MKLISMTDFVLEKTEEYRFRDDCEFAHAVRKYAKFLKQPLTLGMFVPCDESGNVLKEPDLTNWQNLYEFKGKIKYRDWRYQEAKEKVLFKGFESVDTRTKDRYQVKLKNANVPGSSDTIQNDFAGLYFYNSFNEKSRVKNIEDLLKFHPLELTESAIKQLGL